MNSLSGLTDLRRNLDQLAASGEDIGDAALTAGIGVMSAAARRALARRSPGEDRRQKLQVALSAAIEPAFKSMRSAATQRIESITKGN